MRIRIFLDLIGNMLVPKIARRHLRAYLLKAGITKIPYDKFGLLFFFVFIFNLLSYFTVYHFFLNKPIVGIFSYRLKLNFAVLMIITAAFIFLAQLILTLLSAVFCKFYFDVRIYKRTKKIEAVLPDFLESVNVNLKAGMTFDKALWNSVEEEFSVLEKEIEVVAKKEMSGEDIVNALSELKDKYNSPMLNESVNLIVVGIEEGADITDVIEELIKNVRETNFLRKEAVANVMNYIFFISLIATVISPILFAFSFNLLIILQSIGSKVSSSVGATKITLPFLIGKLPFETNNFIIFSRLCIISISVASTFITINLMKGSLKDGVKYVPLFVIISLVIYQLSLQILSVLFKALF